MSWDSWHVEQKVRLAQRLHPVRTVDGAFIPLHAEAAPHDDREAPGPRCGNCRFRARSGVHGGKAECTVDATPPRRRIQVRAWWPACVDYVPEEVPSPCRCDDPDAPRVRGRCKSCYTRAVQSGELVTRPKRSAVETAEEYQFLTSMGESFDNIAARLGIKPESLERALYRARKAAA